MTTISPGGLVLATGIFWQSGAKNEKQAKQRALDLTPQAGVKGAARDFLCIRSTSPVQFGLSSIKDGHQIGMTAAAAALADALPGSWAGLFAVPEGWYFVQTALGFIAPRGDRLFRSEQKDEAIAALLKVESIVDAIYAPTDFAIEHAHERLIEDIIEPTGRFTMLVPNRLRALKAPTDFRQIRITKKQAAVGIAGLVVAAGAGIAVTVWHNRPPALPAIQPVWESARAPAELAQTCSAAVLGHPAIAGYRLQKATCAALSATFTYKGWGRQYRYLSADAIPPAGCAQSFADSGELTVSCPVPSGPTQGRQALARTDDAKRLIFKHLSGLGLDVKLTPATEQQKTDEPDAPAVSVPIFKIDVDGKFVPEILSAELAELPGMTIDAITFTPPATWHVQGKLYYVR